MLRNAAERGDEEAQLMLGALLADGRIVPKDLVQAHVFFDLLLISGDERNRMLEALDWEGLRSHISAVKGMGGAALTLKAGLEAMEAPTLVCLRISDSNTEGLTGDDWDETGNFRRLCVQNFSTGDEAGRGGSFGLGKAVSWMHSRLLTVLFS